VLVDSVRRLMANRLSGLFQTRSHAVVAAPARILAASSVSSVVSILVIVDRVNS